MSGATLCKKSRNLTAKQHLTVDITPRERHR